MVWEFFGVGIPFSHVDLLPSRMVFSFPHVVREFFGVVFRFFHVVFWFCHAVFSFYHAVLAHCQAIELDGLLRL